ncbi:L-asparaginase 3 [Fusarium albosuccineum]|uniref:asparaginase n=1 Tax=Fusarium albosuccineum TaxID=1237068 RepID=A0A8H4KY28_9HYPO|nr:L-asparaginase 3 [Fusarium albosuccineum]
MCILRSSPKTRDMTMCQVNATEIKQSTPSSSKPMAFSLRLATTFLGGYIFLWRFHTRKYAPNPSHNIVKTTNLRYKSGSGDPSMVSNLIEWDRKTISLEHIKLGEGDSLDVSTQQLLQYVVSIHDIVDKKSPWGVVAAFGTDQAVELSVALAVTFGSKRELSVVVTGASKPATEIGADGPANISDAIAVAATESARKLASMIVCSGLILHPLTTDKFDVSSIQPFQSYETGPLGRVVKCETVSGVVHRTPFFYYWAPPEMEILLHVKELAVENEVPIVHSINFYPGYESLLEGKQMDGLVFAGGSDGYGPNKEIQDQLKKNKTILVVAHQGARGIVVRDATGSGIPVGNIYPRPARTMLLFGMLGKKTEPEMKQYFAIHGGLIPHHLARPETPRAKL